jgi:hypothetical protein
MPFACSACSKNLPVGADRAGQRLRCPWCGTAVTVGAAPMQVTTAPARAAGPPPPPPQVREAAGTSPAVWIAVALAGGGALMVLLVGSILAGFLLFRSGASSTTVVTTTAQGSAAPIDGQKIDPGQPAGVPVDLAGRLAGIQNGDPATKPAAPADDTRGLLPAGRGVEPVGPAGDGSKFAVFMGTKAMGSRFCIIADVSGSMSANRRIDRLKDELKKTIDGLATDQQFHLIVFHSAAEPQPVPGWLSGGRDVEKVRGWIDAQKPRGGTMPMTAFEMAFRLDPKPDVIFFMTDGIIPTNVPPRVKALNDTTRPRVPVNTILFGGEAVMPAFRTPPRMTEATRKKLEEQFRKRFEESKQRGEKMLRQLADDSGGTYRFVADTPPAP